MLKILWSYFHDIPCCNIDPHEKDKISWFCAFSGFPGTFVFVSGPRLKGVPMSLLLPGFLCFLFQFLNVPFQARNPSFQA